MRLIPPAVALGCLVLSSTCLAQAPDWSELKTNNAPSSRFGHGMAHDAVRDRTVIFGGWNTGTSVVYMNDTWEFDGRDWVRIQPKTVPPVRAVTSMVYHLARARTLMFGGHAPSGGDYNDTWEWNGQDWTRLSPKNSPPARSNLALAYDSSRQRTVLFGGQNSSGALNDTWEFDGVNWTQIMTKNAPSARFSNMAYDPVRKRMVLFSGYGRAFIQDTWEYDGKDWTKMNPTTQPSGRCCVGLAYDIARKRIVLFGGLDLSSFLNDTWEYDGRTWTQVRPASSPPTRHDHDSMVYSMKRQSMLVFGGYGTRGHLADTWEYASPALGASPPTISIATGGTQTFTLNAKPRNAHRLYWLFGSITGTSPGVTLASPAGSVHLPLNPDIYTDITIAFANSPLLTKTRGALDASGQGSATFQVPKITNQSAIGVRFYHAYLVYDANNNNLYMASNPVELILAK